MLCDDGGGTDTDATTRRKVQENERNETANETPNGRPSEKGYEVRKFLKTFPQQIQD